MIADTYPREAMEVVPLEAQIDIRELLHPAVFSLPKPLAAV